PAAAPEANAVPMQGAAPQEQLELEEKVGGDKVSRMESGAPPAAPPATLGKSGRYSYNQALEQDPKAVLQTGPGVPTWSWRSHVLQWSGPVSRDHTIRLFLASPNLNRLLTAIRLALLAAFCVVVFTGRLPRWPARAAAGTVSSLAVGMVLLT